MLVSLGAQSGSGVWPAWLGGDDCLGTSPSRVVDREGGGTFGLGVLFLFPTFTIFDNFAAERIRKKVLLAAYSLYIYIHHICIIYIYYIALVFTVHRWHITSHRDHKQHHTSPIIADHSGMFTVASTSKPELS